MLQNYTPHHLRTCLVCRGEIEFEDDYDIATDCIVSKNYFLRHHSTKRLAKANIRTTTTDKLLEIAGESRIIVGVLENTLYDHCLHYFTIIQEDGKSTLCQSFVEQVACSIQVIDLSVFLTDIQHCLANYDKERWEKYFPFTPINPYNPSCISIYKLSFYQ